MQQMTSKTHFRCANATLTGRQRQVPPVRAIVACGVPWKQRREDYGELPSGVGGQLRSQGPSELETALRFAACESQYLASLVLDR